MCVNTEGEELWKKTIAHGNRIVRGGEGNSAAPSPVTDGEHVWAFFGTGDLVCYDFQGNQVWHTNIAKRYGTFSLYFVMASTPLIDKDRLYMHLIHSNAWLVLALDKMTGEEVWKHNRQSDATEECEHAYTSPILYRDAEREYLVVHGADYVTAHSLEDGSEIWRCGDLNPKARYNYSLRFVASPAATEGLIVVPSAKNGPVVGIDPAAQGDITNGKWQRWKLKQGTPDVPSPVIHGGLVYLCRENGDLICLDAATGEQLYRERTHRHRHRASPVYANGHIYLTSRDGVINVVKTGRQFELIASNFMNEVIASSPVITNQALYLRTYQALYASVGVNENLQRTANDAGSNIIGQVTAQMNRLQQRLTSVKHTVAIMSGKGGVGKSSLTANLATALTLKGNTVGVVDADINGPTLAKMMGVRDATLEYTPVGVKPAVAALGTKLISMDLLLAEDEAPVLWNAHSQKDAFTWRSTMEVGALREFIADTEWGELDYLLLDLPPGTDRLPNVAELIPNLGGVVVATIPSEVSQLIVKKSVTMARDILKVPIIGVVENMAFYVCQHCGEKEPLFSDEESLDNAFQQKILGSVPFDPRLARANDSGTPYLDAYPNAPASKELMQVAEKIQDFFKPNL